MTIKIISLNMWQGGNLFDAILSFLHEEQPDILALQEVYDGTDPHWERNFRSIETLQENLNLPFYHFAPAFLERTNFGKVEQGNAIFSRFPIISSAVSFYDISYGEREDKPEYFEYTPRNLQHVELDIHGKRLHVLNTQGVWGEDGNDNERRLAMGRTIAKELSRLDLAILAGDFNVKEHTNTIEMIEAYTKNVFKNELLSTFNMRVKTNPGYAVAVVDMIFVTPNIQILQKSCPDIDVTDHLPLVATLSVPLSASDKTDT